MHRGVGGGQGLGGFGQGVFLAVGRRLNIVAFIFQAFYPETKKPADQDPAPDTAGPEAAGPVALPPSVTPEALETPEAPEAPETPEVCQGRSPPQLLYCPA